MHEINKIWEPYLSLLQQDGDLSKLRYSVKGNHVSPYLELQAESIYGNGNYNDGQAHLDVNPYVRFFNIFDPLLTPDDMGYEEFTKSLSDVLLHYLADLDIKMGMCRHDFYISLIVRDMEQGAFGGLEDLQAFTRMEKRETAGWLLQFYRTGEGPSILSRAVGELLPDCEVYIREGEEFVFYMRQPWDAFDNHKLKYLIHLFLPLSCSCTVHWTKTYGVIGYEGTMPLEGFILA